MKLTKIYKVLKFKESDWMKIYINFNTKKRENAPKSMVNPVYVKTLQNLLKRTMTNKKKLFKTCQQTNFYFSKSNRLFEIHEIKLVLTLNKPIYFRFTVL